MLTTAKFINEILETYNDRENKYGNKPEHFGLFYWKEDGIWCGCDNTTGDCWIEEFETMEECLAWLNGEEEK